MSPPPEHEGLRDALRLAALTAAYVLTARLGLSIEPVSGFATLVWPPTGIALFALFTFGVRLWPGVLAGALVANVLSGAPAAVALGIACGNTAEAVIATLLLKAVGFDARLGRVRDVGALLVLGAVVSTLASATVGVFSLALGGIVTSESFVATWQAWWVGDGLGALTVAPLLFVFSRRDAFRLEPRRLTEAAAVLAVLAALALVVFASKWIGMGEHGLNRPFVVFPALFWAALRFGPRGAVAATGVLSGIAIAGASMGLGPFAGPTLSESLIVTQLFMAVSAATALVLAAAISERDAARGLAEENLDTSRFLSRASAILSSSLDVETTLQAVAPLVVPRLGDNCVVDLVDPDGTIRRVAEAAARPEKLELLEKLRAWPPGPSRPSPVLEVLRTGKTRFIPDFDGAALARLSAGDAYTDIVRQIGPTSSVTVPLLARGKALGAITFGMAESGRAYTASDIALAEELAGRAGVAIDHALVHRASVRASAEASEALKVREDFLAIAGHELKTPLTSLLLQVQGLQRALKTGQPVQNLADRLQRAASAGLRLEGLINQLLDVTRITAGRLALEPERFELEVLLRDVVDRFSEQAKSEGSELRLSVQSSATGTWDRMRLDQVLSNLMANAIKYGQGQPVDIELSQENGEAVVRVKDRGIGIDAQQQEKIFNRFERAVGTREFGGFGLGLWISRRIAEASGGRIEVESALGQGSTFTLRLPLEPPQGAHVVH